MFSKSEITFGENGVVSMNLPLARHVVGTRSTRTTHPRVLADFEKLFSLIADTSISVGNPLFWLTKTDVVRRLADAGCAELIPTSFSCSRVGLRSRRNLHCGTCSQCIDRRFAILAAGLEQYEPAEGYSVDLLTGARKLDQEATLAGSYVLSAKAFASQARNPRSFRDCTNFTSGMARQ
jgi:hypothetical protein